MRHSIRTGLFTALLLSLLLGVLAVRAESADTGNDAAPSPDANTEALEPEVMPELVTFVDAEYPPLALKEGREGTVLLELLITETGKVDSVAVIESLDTDFDMAAAAAAIQFSFSPALVEGEPVPVLLLFEYSFSIEEQTRDIEEYINFSGVLKERGTRDRIAYATVVVSFASAPEDTSLSVPWTAYLDRIGGFEGQFVEEGSLVAMTDSLGQFAFKSLPAGIFQVKFPNAGYEMITETEVLTAGEQIEGTYFLPRTSYDEYEIVVYGKVEQKEVTRRRLNVTEVERIPGFGGDAIKSIQALPGVARPAFISGEIIVRGSGIEDTRYFLDGIEIPLLFHYGGLKSTYNSRALSDISLYPSGFNSRYGACVGGVIEITGRHGLQDRWRGVFDASLLDASFFIEGPLRKDLTFYMTARRSFIGEVLNGVAEHSDSFNMAAVPYYWDLVGRLDYRPNPRENLFLTVFAAKDKMELVYDDDDAGSSEVSEATNAISMDSFFRRFILGYDRDFGDRFRNELRLSRGSDDYRGHFFGYFDYRFKTDNWILRDELAFKQNEKALYRFGLDFARYPVDYRVAALGAGDSNQDEVYGNYGFYTNVELKLRDRLLLIPGYRYDYFHELGEGKSSYRLTSRFGLNDSHTLTGAIGTYSQSPAPKGQATDPVFGNPDLPPTLATHLTIGDEWQINDMLSLKTETYYNTQSQIPFETDSEDFNFLPDQDGRMYGIEFMLRRDQGRRFFGWLSYGLSRSERRTPRKPDSNIVGAWDPNSWYSSGYDQTHHIEAVGSWNMGRTWSTGLRARYVSGNPTTAILGYTGDQYEYDSDYGEYVDLLGEYREDRMGPFFQLDFRLDKKFVYKNWILSAYLDVQNLNYFFYNSPEFYSYNFDSSERQTIGGIVLPTIGIRAEF